jgi:hypothetical protein
VADEDKLGGILQGYATVAAEVLERWSALASTAAEKLNAGEYGLADYAEDWLAAWWLLGEGSLMWAEEGVEACETLSGPGGGGGGGGGGVTGSRGPRQTATSLPFEAPPGAKLTLLEPILKGEGLQALPSGAVTIEPAAGDGLAEGSFQLRAEVSGCRGATYVGTVVAATDGGEQEIPVWIVVP